MPRFTEAELLRDSLGSWRTCRAETPRGLFARPRPEREFVPSGMASLGGARRRLPAELGADVRRAAGSEHACPCPRGVRRRRRPGALRRRQLRERGRRGGGAHRAVGWLELVGRRRRGELRRPCPRGVRRWQRSGAVRGRLLLDRGRPPGEQHREVGRLGLVAPRQRRGLSTLQQTDVRALAVFDDGSGPALYAGGSFTRAGGGAANGIARWDGSGWSALGSGVGPSGRIVDALTVFDDGSGPALCVGGSFTLAGGATAFRIASVG